MSSIAAVEPHSDQTIHHPDDSHQKKTIWSYLWSYDHKIIGYQYLFTSLAFLFLGGGLALILRWQLGFPGTGFPLIGRLIPEPYAVEGAISPGFYNMLFTMHATVMVFLVIMPLLIGAFGNFLIPLQIGARDMAFPLLNELSYWLYFTSGVILCYSFFVPGGAANSGWTAYAPLSTVAAYNLTAQGQTLWCLGLFVNGLASIAGAVNYITTILNMRAPGMTLFRMPLTVWALFITSILLLLAVPVLSAAAVMLMFDLNFGTHFFTPYAKEAGETAVRLTGGQPLLWQHLFWFFGHPEVYIMILPAMGLVSEVLPVFARKPIFGYKAMVYAMAVIGFLGFIVWGHHMYVSGMSLTLSSVFSFSTILIAVPSAIKTFNWLGTLWGGSIRFTSAMISAICFISMFVIGGLSGIFIATTTVDLFVHHTYFIVAHIHYVLFGGSLFGAFAGLYYWYPKMFGRMMNETLGKIHVILSFILMNFTFFPMHNLGLGGMMRRIADPTLYEHLRPLQPINQFVTLSAIALGFVQFILIYNFFVSLKRGKKAPINPWNANTLEWTVPSPPPHGNFGPTLPTVYHGPYEYSVPGALKDHIMQTEPPEKLPERARQELAAAHQ
ncbi:MAG: cbb3-type cytochrome c oxidase subunit I [Methylacidiphilales bacterium]|nr:cbb3-type cytochrome c oxidase subunit I [Candidatus Methylacidiphilales bacterium]MDW8348870.1 cbb3-type cytochrome c oxidase subunit I [Verrucomicrobiae bacterium]